MLVRIYSAVVTLILVISLSINAYTYINLSNAHIELAKKEQALNSVTNRYYGFFQWVKNRQDNSYKLLPKVWREKIFKQKFEEELEAWSEPLVGKNDQL